MEEIHERVKRMRLEMGLSQMKLAQKAGIDHHTVWDMEHGRYKPNCNTAVSLARVFGVTVDYLLTGKEPTALMKIRCPDCKHWKEDLEWCSILKCAMYEDDFCSYWEKKDKEHPEEVTE